ncbi:MAG TPA: DUF2207 domain-containing protein, partial [Stenomitos sp.]
MRNYRWFKRIILASIALFVTLVITVTHAAAQNLPFNWEFINVNIDVQPNGDMLVTETQKYVFNTAYTNQRYRYIPLSKVEEITDITVQENGKTIPSQTGIKNNQQWIRWQHQLNPPEDHTFVLSYRVVGGLHVDTQKTQVYWKAIFADRKAPVQAATVKVQLPEPLSGKVLSFTNFGVSAIARQLNPRTFEFVANQPLEPGQELEVQIAFPTDILNVPKPRWQRINLLGNLVGFYFGFWFLTVPATVFAVCYALSLLANRCPQCKAFKLKHTTQILVAPTRISGGRQRVTSHCYNCSYHTEYEQTLPRISESYPS